MTKRAAAVYRERVRSAIGGLRRFRFDPVKLDWALAFLLAFVSGLQIWLGSINTDDRLVAAVFAGALATTVAIRRRYPTVAGIAAAVLTAVELSVWGDPQLISGAVAYFCALYALAVWSPPRRFVLGVVTLIVVNLASSAGPHVNLEERRHLHGRHRRGDVARASRRRRP